MRVAEADLPLADGRTLHFYDTGSDADTRLAVFWHHGTPNIGAPPEPLFDAAVVRGIRWVSYDRPGYGGSSPRPGRDVASASADMTAIADALGIRRFAVMGHSGGAVHALACAALAPDRVVAAVCISGLAPFGAEGLDWFAGMAAGGVAGLRAAAAGREAFVEFLATSEFDPELFTAADYEVLGGVWAWLGVVVSRAEGDHAGRVDDELAYVTPWGFDPGPTIPPVLLVHGGEDRMTPSTHSEWLARRNPSARLWLRPDDGHISVLRSSTEALDWLTEQAKEAE